MTSIFQQSRLNTEEEPEAVNPIFSEVKSHKKENIIPPVGISKPELVDSFIENIGDEEKIRKSIQEAEEYERETPFQTGTREVLSHAARGVEGLFGGINSFINMLTPELYLDEDSQPYEPGKRPKGLPGAAELHEWTKEQTGNYLEPKSDLSKVSQETISDIGSMFSTPGLGFWQKLMLPIGGQVTKQSIKASGGSETSQNIGKLGFMTLASIANLGNAPKAAKQAIQQAEQMIPQGVRFSAQPTEQALQKLKNSNWYTSGKTPSKGPAMDEIQRIEAQISNGTIDAHMAMQLRKDINEARAQLGGFQLNKPVNKERALHYLDEVDNALISSMENYGNNINPEWLKRYRLGNEAYRITRRSQLISNIVDQYAKPLKSETAKVLLHVGAGSAISTLPATAGAALPVIGAAKSIQVMNRMIRSPVLRNHYLDVVKKAATGNAAATQKAIEKFDMVAKKLEEKNSQ